MPHFNFKEIEVIDDKKNDLDIIKDIIKLEEPEDAFYIADIGDIIKRHQAWISKMPRVIPHYGMSATFIALFSILILHCFPKCIYFNKS